MYKTFLLLALGLASCLGNVLPEVEDVNGTSSRFGALNRYFLHNIKNYGYDIPLTVAGIGNSASRFSENPSHTIILIHGQGQNKDSRFNNELIRALLEYDDKHRDVNIDIIVVDWEYYASQSNAAMTVPNIAAGIVEFIDKLLETPFPNANNGTKTNNSPKLTDAGKVHIIGFDLGAHVAGIVGRGLSAPIARITGLDPTGANWGTNSQRLRETDALYVEVIHTDVFGNTPVGISDPLGRIDIYPNGGTSQPGCTNNNACNHEYAWLLFVATIDVTDRELNANSCSVLTEITSNTCRGPTSVVGGLATRKYGRGLYRANTVANYPYF